MVVADIGSVVDCTLADAAAVVDVVMGDNWSRVFGQTEESVGSQSYSFAFDHVVLDLVVVASFPWVV